MTRYNAIEVKHDGRVAVVRFRSTSLENDREQEDFLREDLRRLLESIETAKVIVDLDGVVNCSSGALGALIETQKELTRRSGQLYLCRLNDHLREKVRTLNLENTVFSIFENASDAIAAIRQPPR